MGVPNVVLHVSQVNPLCTHTTLETLVGLFPCIWGNGFVPGENVTHSARTVRVSPPPPSGHGYGDVHCVS
jgi:hypothetical protein